MTLDKKILVGFAAGIGDRLFSRAAVARIALQQSLIAMEPIGTAFIRLISMVVVPLVIASVFVGVASLGDVRTLGRVGGKTLAYFLATTLAAAIVGLTVASVARVGEGLPPADRDALVGQLGPAVGDQRADDDADDRADPAEHDPAESVRVRGTGRRRPAAADHRRLHLRGGGDRH